MAYVADTHALFWFLTEDERLGREAKTVFEKTEQGSEEIVIPTIVLVELHAICVKKQAMQAFKDIVAKIESASNYTSYPLEVDAVKAFDELASISESHDRIIVATAKLLGLPLLTKDPDIISSGKVKTVW